MLEASRKHEIKRFIYASSAYALSDKGSFYGLSKLFSEKIVEEYSKKYGLDFTIIRFGSVYGARDYENNYVYNVIKDAVTGKKIVHCGDGEEVREYIHAADAAKLCLNILLDDRFINDHVILTGVERLKRKELFSSIQEILCDDIEIEYQNEGYKNHYKFTPYSFNPTLSKKLVANPFIDMGQGMLECIQSIHECST